MDSIKIPGRDPKLPKPKIRNVAPCSQECYTRLLRLPVPSVEGRRFGKNRKTHTTRRIPKGRTPKSGLQNFYITEP